MNAEWIDRSLYPFEHHAMMLDGGEEIHYLDEGLGHPVVFVHGTPTWSFLWRAFVREFRSDFRCLAPDNLGFGLSAKPEDADYTPKGHASRLNELVERLGLSNIVLVVHDFGGPIGLAYALEHSANVRAIVLMNTWMWSLAGDRVIAPAAKLLGSSLGRFLYRRFDLSTNLLLRAAFVKKEGLNAEIHRHYRAPFSRPSQRMAPWVLARELLGSSDWFAELWEQRDALEGKPMLIVWGVRDLFITEKQLARWESAYPRAQVVRLDEVGHFVQEEGTTQAILQMRRFLTGSVVTHPSIVDAGQ